MESETNMDEFSKIMGDVKIIPIDVNSCNTMVDDLTRLFSSDEAGQAKGVVYFFLANKPIPRLKGESTVFYIGKTDKSLRARWLSAVKKLNSEYNRKFYDHIINEYGGFKVGYLLSDQPRVDERKIFRMYTTKHLEFPPKSKVG